MNSLRDLVLGQGCAPDQGASQSNPLARLADGLLNSSRKQDVATASALSEVGFSAEAQAKVASRAAVVTRHVFPEAPREFQEQQTQQLIQSISAGEGPSWRDDQQYTQFLQGLSPPQHAAEASGSQAWADEFTTHPAPNGNQWADSFQDQFRRPQEHHASSSWAEQFHQRQVHHQPGPSLGISGGGWAKEFARSSSAHMQTQPNQAPGSAWAEQFSASNTPGAAWAQEYVEAKGEQERLTPEQLNATEGPSCDEPLESDGAASWGGQEQQLTPEQLKAMKGPSRDDPLESGSAASWVQQYNEELAAPSRNALEYDMAALEASCSLVPVQDNPYCSHALPLQAAQQLERDCRPAAAALAYEAAARAAPTNREAWWNLGRLRLELGECRAAVGPLKHTLRGWPTHVANPQAWRALVQAAMAAGQKEAASEALSRWLESLSGRPDAAVDLGSGGAAPALETEAALQERIAKNGNDPLAWEMLGYLHTLRGNHAAATEALGKCVVSSRGHDTTALCLLGESLSRQEQHAEAERVFKAAAIPGGPVRAIVGLAKAQSGQGMVRDGDLGGRNSGTVQSSITVSCTVIGRLQEAAASYCRAIEICPDASKLWDSLAMLLTVLGRFDVADAAARQDPSALKGVLIRA